MLSFCSKKTLGFFFRATVVPDHVLEASLRRPVERRGPLRVPGVGVGLAVAEEGADVGEASPGRQVEGGDAVVGLGVHVRALLAQDSI